jgi:hypothetical protein
LSMFTSPIRSPRTEFQSSCTTNSTQRRSSSSLLSNSIDSVEYEIDNSVRDSSQSLRSSYEGVVIQVSDDEDGDAQLVYNNDDDGDDGDGDVLVSDSPEVIASIEPGDYFEEPGSYRRVVEPDSPPCDDSWEALSVDQGLLCRTHRRCHYCN